MRERNTFQIALPLVIFFALIGCQDQSARTSPPSSGDGLPPELSPCNLTFDQVGQSVQAAGSVMFVDDTPPDGLYADLEADNCRVGIAVEDGTFSGWNAEQQAAFNVGSEITVAGNLASYPFPERPEEMQLVIELTAPPVIGYAAEFSPRELDAPSGTLCHFPEDQVGQTVKAAGKILFVDSQAAAGLYAEMGSDEGCVYRLWVERTRWDTWSEEQQSGFVADRRVEVEGILTLVLNEQNIDLSIPPRGIE